jgi:hypothetical protein
MAGRFRKMGVVMEGVEYLLGGGRERFEGLGSRIVYWGRWKWVWELGLMDFGFVVLVGVMAGFRGLCRV